MVAAWTTLEWASLVVAAMVPLVVGVLGAVVARSLRHVEDAQWGNRKLIELRLELYSDMALPLNDLLCFFRCVGDYAEITPPEALRRKRRLDKSFYVGEHLMSGAFAAAYHAFMEACFLTFTARAAPAQLRASIKKQRAEREHWEPAWDVHLIPVDMTPTGLAEINARYKALMAAFRRDIGIGDAER
ncbi:hypothetical protein [Conexibacter woesei]|uniref:Uncharacterized protein n=1 Tax=Conexibacter woesei (strain DSM 14684 / CCUG 47730 / CIP 108061 / JCM 11494 / NBRC 100937 / ID131577) TaxID=469383 RepID=D3F7F2_CONWI|nr:hypothetical protein [Conexibacter woesei]ADB50814.1 conserved hypothetical protein [Conexibacter woesei DSM 14684]